MGGYGLGLGVTAIISPMSISSSFTLDGKPSDQEIFNKYGSDQEKMRADIESALSHGNNVFSIVLGLSLYFGM